MARFRPFRGIRFAADKVGGFETVVAPPYDVISPDRRDELLRAGSHNVTRLILNPAGHGEAARHYRGWLADGTLTRESAPVFYLYRQDFECDGAKSRVGVIGRCTRNAHWSKVRRERVGAKPMMKPMAAQPISKKARNPSSMMKYCDSRGRVKPSV